MSVSKVIVFGAHGKIGQHVIKLLSKLDYKTTAVVRNDEQASTIQKLADNSSNVSSTNLTIDEASVKDLSGSIKGNDAVILTVGSAGKNLLQVDLDGVVKTFEASVEANVKRLILISAIHAENREFGEKSQIRDYYIAKHYADRILIDEFSNKLDYTIIKPTHLTDDPSTGKIDIIKNLNEDVGKISRTDVAKVLVEILNLKETYGKSYNIKNGSHDIDNPSTYEA
ncbi:uncharacterized protein KGF55_002332 [Candida pseudojiufengensis]|uniref:uncharacterized protein n=1 Tax=Candida pseudojiufengensis TaxID=497109 RepID=UPI0022254A46|nr:uncharacterized protein KGF55_002332 [Candida pseudojiufengensis]KAI5963452.1 hypothetical protein KGF55_002332 [Candida pseudojiufengensis]